MSKKDVWKNTNVHPVKKKKTFPPSILLNAVPVVAKDVRYALTLNGRYEAKRTNHG